MFNCRRAENKEEEKMLEGGDGRRKKGASGGMGTMEGLTLGMEDKNCENCDSRK